MTLNEYFDKIICINLDRRTDRWEHATAQFEEHGIIVERFSAIDMGNMGNHGCTASHGAVIRMIVENGWERTLVFEDDIKFRYPNTQELFSEYIEEVPDDWFLLYLSGHYGNVPKRRVSPHVIHFDYMKTTSSYGVKLESAKIMVDQVSGGTPIDEIYSGFSKLYPCYIFEPRIAFQYANYSDLERHVTNNEWCMTDGWHVAQLG